MLTSKQETAFFALLGAILLVFLGLTYALGHPHAAPPLSERPDPFANISLEAKSAYVYDVTSERAFYAKNENLRLPLASLTKVMAALVASELAPPDSSVTISREAILTEGDFGLLTGERWRLRDLLDFSLISSANDGIKATALSLGDDKLIELMNKKADELGMRDTYYFNVTGLDLNDKAGDLAKGGAYGSAKDQAILFEHVLRSEPTLLMATSLKTLYVRSLDGILHTVDNTDLIVDLIPGLIASKTGYTDLAGGNLVVAFDPEIGRPIIVAVLGSSEEGRFEDVLKLVEASLERVQNGVISKQ